jgi:hypothetical protein
MREDFYSSKNNGLQFKMDQHPPSPAVGDGGQPNTPPLRLFVQ